MESERIYQLANSVASPCCLQAGYLDSWGPIHGMRKCRMKKQLHTFLYVVLAASGMQSSLPVYGAEEFEPKYQEEVQYLLNYLGTSNCQFYRNGEWYGPEKAKEHLDRKYKYLLKKSLIHNTEEFIAYGGTQSSASGEPYQVRCGSAQAVPSAQWLSSELTRYREQVKSKR